MHLCTTDKNRMAVALTSTVNFVFGSQVLDPVTGVILNDEASLVQVFCKWPIAPQLDDFNRPGIANSGLLPSPCSCPCRTSSVRSNLTHLLVDFPAPNKRPTSSITPTIIENPDGTFLFAAGAAGSTRIYTATLQTILGNLDYGLNVSGAIEAPRAHHMLYPNVADLDSGFPDALVEGLTARGHNVTGARTVGRWLMVGWIELVHDINEITSSVQAIRLEGDILWGMQRLIIKRVRFELMLSF